MLTVKRRQKLKKSTTSTMTAAAQSEEAKFIERFQQYHRQRFESKVFAENKESQIKEEMVKCLHHSIAELELMLAWRDKPYYTVYRVSNPPPTRDKDRENKMASYIEKQKIFSNASSQISSAIGCFETFSSKSHKQSEQLLFLSNKGWRLIPDANEADMSVIKKIFIEFNPQLLIPINVSSSGDLGVKINLRRALLNLKMSYCNKFEYCSTNGNVDLSLSDYINEKLSELAIKKTRTSYKSEEGLQTHYLLHKVFQNYMNYIQFETLLMSFKIAASTPLGSETSLPFRTNNETSPNFNIFQTNHSIEFQLLNSNDVFSIEFYQGESVEETNFSKNNENSKSSSRRISSDRAAILLMVFQTMAAKLALELHREMANVSARWPAYNKFGFSNNSPPSNSNISSAHANTVFKNFNYLSVENQRRPAIILMQTCSHLNTVFTLMSDIDKIVHLLNNHSCLGRASISWECSNISLVSPFTLQLSDFTFSAYVKNGLIHVGSHQIFSYSSEFQKCIIYKIYTHIVQKVYAHIRALLGPDSVKKLENVIEFQLGVFHPVLNIKHPVSVKTAIFQLQIGPKLLITPNLYVVHMYDECNTQKKVNIWNQIIGKNYIDKITGFIFSHQREFQCKLDSL